LGLIIFNPDFIYVVTYSTHITENGLTPKLAIKSEIKKNI